MQLPPSLREAINRELEGVALRDLTRASELLSQRYRAEVRDHRFHVDDELTARAYLTTRLPATYAAVVRSLQAVSDVCPEFAPRNVLDIGAGPGTATWAAAERWSSLEHARLIEGSDAMQAVGTRLASALSVRMDWTTASVDALLPGIAAHDLVLMTYVLDELEPAARDPITTRLWTLTRDVLVIVEPGTSSGWQRILRARDLLIASGAELLAPCPHARACPLNPPDWCHFSARVARSRLHREAKGGTVPWEDEKFIYLAASRRPSAAKAARVLSSPSVSKARILLKLCQPDGTAVGCEIHKRDREAFKAAQKLTWGATSARTDTSRR